MVFNAVGAQEVLVLGQAEKAEYIADVEYEGIDSLVFIDEPGRLCVCDDIEVYYDTTKESLAYKTFAEPDTCHKYQYWKNGQLKKHVIYLSEPSRNVPVWWWEEAYCENGQLIYRGPTFNQSERFAYVLYDCNGGKRKEFIREGEGIVGEIKLWYANGQLKEVWNWKDYKEDGEWKYFSEAGSLVKVEVYDMGKLVETKNY